MKKIARKEDEAMKYGYIKAALCAPETRTGAAKFNAEKIKESISEAAAKKAEIIVFGENAVVGGNVGSMENYETLLSGAEKAVKELADFSKTIQSLIVVGFPLGLRYKTVSAAALIFGGKIYAVCTDSDEYEQTAEICGERVNIVSGAIDLPFFDTRISIVFGEKTDVASDAEIIIDLSCGESLIGSLKSRAEKAKETSKRLMCAYMHISCFGEKTAAENGELLVSSDFNESAVFAEIDADAIKKARRFGGYRVSDASTTIEIPVKPKNTDITRNIAPLPFVPEADELPRILDIMGRGIYSRMTAAKAKSVILGLSGGLDSTMVLVACVKLFESKKLDKKNIIAVTMSGFGSSDRTKNNARDLIAAMGVTGIDVPIADAVTQHLKDISHGGKKDTVYENAQARERTQILLDLSNKHGALLLGTGDLSETALGWSTFGGDQTAQFNPNCSAAKTLIRAVMRNYCLTANNADAARIINDVLATPVSPELIKGQVTEDVLGPYELHDFFLYNYIGKGFSAEKTVYLAGKAFPDFTKKTIVKHLKTFANRFFANQFKRNASCDGVKLSEFDLIGKIISSEFSAEQFAEEIEKLSE